MCRVCECYRGSIVVMDVFWHRLSVTDLKMGDIVFGYVRRSKMAA